MSITKFEFSHGTGNIVTRVDSIPKGLRIHHKCDCCENIRGRKVNIWVYKKKREYFGNSYMACSNDATYIISKEKLVELISEGNVYSGCRNFGGVDIKCSSVTLVGDHDVIELMASKGREIKKETKKDVSRPIGNAFAYSLSTSVADELTKAGDFFDCHIHPDEKLSHSLECKPRISFTFNPLISTLIEKYSTKSTLTILERKSDDPSSYFNTNDISVPYGKPKLVIHDSKIVAENTYDVAKREFWRKTGIRYEFSDKDVISNHQLHFDNFIVELPPIDKIHCEKFGDDDPLTSCYVFSQIHD